MDPSQKSDTLIYPKIKNHNVTFHTRSVANEFTGKLLKKLTKLHFFIEKKNFFTNIKKNHKNILFFTKL